MNIKTITRLGLLSSLMLLLGIVERNFPIAPGIPGIKLGLANSVLLYALCLINTKSAWILAGIKVVLGGILYSGPIAMMYSASGTILSMLAMILTLKVKDIGFIGISVCGAVMHMLGQILISRFMLGTWAVVIQVPILLVSAVVTGILTGIVTQMVCKALVHSMPDSKKRLKDLGLYK